MGNFFVWIGEPLRADLPGLGRALVYELAIEALTAEQRQRLAALLAGRFGLPAADVERDLAVVGCPILADGCVVIIEHAQRWLS